MFLWLLEVILLVDLVKNGARKYMQIYIYTHTRTHKHAYVHTQILIHLCVSICFCLFVSLLPHSYWLNFNFECVGYWKVTPFLILSTWFSPILINNQLVFRAFFCFLFCMTQTLVYFLKVPFFSNTKSSIPYICFCTLSFFHLLISPGNS